MGKLTFHLGSILGICLFFFVSAVYADPVPKFTILTEDWEPYNFERDGVVRGISADMLVLMLERTGSSQGFNDIKIYPWARAYQIAYENPGTILFTTTRTEEREKMFRWVGPIFEIAFNIYALKSRHIVITSFEDLRKYRIGTLRSDVTEALLIKKAGMKMADFHQVASNIQNTKMLLLGRIDLVAHSWDTLAATCKEAGIDPGLIEPVFLLDKKSMYYAFHRETPESVITLFQTAFDELKKEGRLAEIFRNYGK